MEQRQVLTDEPEENKATAQRAIDAANSRDRDAFDACYGPEVRVNIRGRTFTVDHDAHWEVMEAMFAAFPDLVESTQQMIAEGDRVFVHSRYSGTHEGPWRGVPASGRTIEWDLLQLLRLEDGVIVEDTPLMDELRMFEQIGAFTPPTTR